MLYLKNDRKKTQTAFIWIIRVTERQYCDKYNWKAVNYNFVTEIWFLMIFKDSLKMLRQLQFNYYNCFCYLTCILSSWIQFVQWQLVDPFGYWLGLPGHAAIPSIKTKQRMVFHHSIKKSGRWNEGTDTKKKIYSERLTRSKKRY